MTKYTLHDIHIDPEKTWLMDFDEYYGGKKTYSKYLIEPYGPYQHNELLDTVYVDPNHEMCYHEHTRGVETFLVDGGSVLTEICGKKAVCTKGDIVHISAYTPHKFTWIDAGTIWRELFQETRWGKTVLPICVLKNIIKLNSTWQRTDRAQTASTIPIPLSQRRFQRNRFTRSARTTAACVSTDSRAAS